MSILNLKKTVLGTALVASALATATPAMADNYGGYRRGGGDTAGAAVVGGMIGLAIGALIGSAGSNHDRRCDGDRDDDRRCYRQRYDGAYNGGGYYNGYPQGGYYNGYPQGGYYGNDGRNYRHERHDDDRGYNGGYRGY